MRRLLLLLPVLLVIAALAAVRGCDGDTSGPVGSRSVARTRKTAVEAEVTPVASPRHDERRRVRTPAASNDAESATTEAAHDALPHLRGRVVDADGRPLRGLLVRARPESSLAADFDVEIASPPLSLQTHTDEDGRFALTAILEMRHSIEVRVPLGGSDDVVLKHDVAGVDDEILIVVPRTRVLHVTLVAAGGEPVPNTVVDVTTPELLLENGDRILAATQRKRTGHRFYSDTVEGHFSLRLPEGLRPTYTLRDHHTLTLAVAPAPTEGASEIVLVASEGAAIEGVCVDQHGDPVAGAGVFAASRGDEPTHGRIAGADEDGRFRITGLTPGARYTIGARRHGYMDGEAHRELAAGATDVRLELVKGRTVNGVLRRADGPLADSGVLVLTGAFRGTWLQYEVPVHGGRFVWRGVVGDDLQAEFRPDDGDEVSLGRLPEPGPDGLIELVLPD